MSNARHTPISEASRTPETDALVSRHSDEHVAMYAAGNWRQDDAVRQARELLKHARSLETQRDAALERELGLRDALDALLNALPSATTHPAIKAARAALAAKGEK